MLGLAVVLALLLGNRAWKISQKIPLKVNYKRARALPSFSRGGSSVEATTGVEPLGRKTGEEKFAGDAAAEGERGVLVLCSASGWVFGASASAFGASALALAVAALARRESRSVKPLANYP